MRHNRDKQESQTFRVQNAYSVSPQSLFIPTIDERYTPYDHVEILNKNLTNTIEVTINNNVLQEVTPGSQMFFTQLMQNIIIKNIGLTDLAISDISIQYKYTGYRSRGMQRIAGMVKRPRLNLRWWK